MPGPTRDPGLSVAEAAARLRSDGFNELPSSKPRSLFAIAIDVVREPMFLLLIGSGVIYLLLGDAEEALALLAAVFLVIGITLYQEQKTEHALQALRDLSSPRALVVRGGALQRIAGRDVVRGDLVVLREGDRVPADARIESATNLSADESLLTGESVPVAKSHSTNVYSGTLVVRGDGIARVFATGAATELGKIGTALKHVDVGRTRLQQEVARVVRLLALAGLAACVVVGVVYGASRASWLDGALAGLTLAISMIPEEFAVILTIFLALGAWRLSKRQVLTRRVPTVETLGSATVLCVDKTGTLTLNRMAIAAIAAGADVQNLTTADVPLLPAAVDVLATAVRASRPDAFDPMERACFELAAERGLRVDTDRAHLVREYPLSDTQLAVVQVWQQPAGSPLRVAAKGAPETIAALTALSSDVRDRALRRAAAMADSGLRVIGVAAADWPAGDPLPDRPVEFGLRFQGFIGLADPVRPGVPSAIQECRGARIRVVMITGDHPSTAISIARQIGLAAHDGCITGAELASMNDDVLRERVRDVDVFARIVPEQKLRLVRALQANGEVVAMTGDGVNDAPALKAADIGIAMGGRGTDVAREAASLVLLDDDFTSIVGAVRLGRRIYENIRKATAYVLAIHVPIAAVSLVPPLIGWPLVLMPVHVIFMELIIDPASSIAFELEPEERDVMAQPPRDPHQVLFTLQLVVRSLLQGIGAAVATLAVFWLMVRANAADDDVRTLTFSTLIVTNVALIFANRSLTQPIWRAHRTPNPALRWLAAGAVGLLIAIQYATPLRNIFRMSRPHGGDLLLIVAAGLAALAWMELVKRLIHTARE